MPCLQREERVDGARPREHHHETGQWTARSARAHPSEAAPVGLCLLARHHAQPQVRFLRSRWPHAAHHPPQLHLRASVPTWTQHLEEARRAKPRIRRQRLPDEGQERIDLRRPRSRQMRQEALRLAHASPCRGGPTAPTRSYRPSSARRKRVDGSPPAARPRSSRRPLGVPLKAGDASRGSATSARIGSLGRTRCTAALHAGAATRPRCSHRRSPWTRRCAPGLRAGTLIRHAAATASAQLTHGGPMIRSPLRAALVTGTGLAPAPGAAARPACLTAVRVTSIAATADEEDGSAPRARTHPQRVLVVSGRMSPNELDSRSLLRIAKQCGRRPIRIEPTDRLDQARAATVAVVALA